MYYTTIPVGMSDTERRIIEDPPVHSVVVLPSII